MFYIKNILVYTLCLPLVGTLFLLCSPSSNQKFLKTVALNFSCATFVLSLFLWIFFNKSIGTFQYVSSFFWIPIFNINFSIGLDGISLFFILLTTLLIPLCFRNWFLQRPLDNIHRFLFLLVPLLPTYIRRPCSRIRLLD